MAEQEDRQHTDELLGEAEPWEPWESKLVGICLLVAVLGLVVLGFLINHFILD